MVGGDASGAGDIRNLCAVARPGWMRDVKKHCSGGSQVFSECECLLKLNSV